MYVYTHLRYLSGKILLQAKNKSNTYFLVSRMQMDLLHIFFREKEPLGQGWTSAVISKATIIGNQVAISPITSDRQVTLKS